ncbi:uncharacterized protein ACA1_378120 [Acanthamoeba castellanii str. Neff]|uniref:Uncharacterized protein n=1 Tax=Acanthamoeba castellanii (strain ATCC 30010 / Neff) TaxID=1257118 RepID=L8GRB7_ACACF|nr:uncharacterized protein ACA1_378120 [Acanthamoeba castellanii str. Neff]ELR15694.1 hypothetical protein ACA1_378120 [Acanthamoeba castellanii str. Neff]
MNICSILERRQLEAAVPGCQIEWIVDDDGDSFADGDDAGELVNVVELIEGDDEDGETTDGGASMMWPFPSSQQLKRKREKVGSGSGSSSSDGEEQHQKQQLNDAKRARLEDVEKPQLFNMWLKMKKERRHDRKLQDLVDAFVLPEDLYQHFKEFVPPAGADADAVFMRRLQYERECAERALNRCKVRSWLLRRSSLNRRSIVLRVPFELGLGDRLQFGAAAANDAQLEITPTFYSTSFIAVLDRLLETEDLRPDRMVHGYLSTRC